MRLFMTIDLEDWYNAHGYAIPRNTWDQCESRVEKNTVELLDLLSKYNIKAIFFVLGYIASRHPDLVREISDRGHIIASHGYWHEKLYEMDKDTFKKDLHTTNQLLEDITGKKVTHFRAPSWTYDERSEYLHEILKEEGIQVDSSLQPFKTPLSGVSNASLEPYYPNIKGQISSILEFPVPVLKLGPLMIPFCGGFYFRVMPYKFIDGCLKRLLYQRDCFIYLHPWEIDSKQPKLQVSLPIKLIHHYGIKGAKRKLEKLFINYKFSDPNRFGVGEFVDGKCSIR